MENVAVTVGKRQRIMFSLMCVTVLCHNLTYISFPWSLSKRDRGDLFFFPPIIKNRWDDANGAHKRRKINLHGVETGGQAAKKTRPYVTVTSNTKRTRDGPAKNGQTHRNENCVLSVYLRRRRRWTRLPSACHKFSVNSMMVNTHAHTKSSINARRGGGRAVRCKFTKGR